MDKKQYIAPTIDVIAIEVQQIMAGSPTANVIQEDSIEIDLSDEDEIDGGECY